MSKQSKIWRLNSTNYSRITEPLKNNTSAKKRKIQGDTEETFWQWDLFSRLAVSQKKWSIAHTIRLFLTVPTQWQQIRCTEQFRLGKGMLEDPFHRGCPSCNSSSSLARRWHPPAAAINTTWHLDTRWGASSSIAELPSSSNKKSHLLTLFSAKCGREHHHLQFSTAFGNCITVFPLEKRGLPSQQNPSARVSALT